MVVSILSVAFLHLVPSEPMDCAITEKNPRLEVLLLSFTQVRNFLKESDCYNCDARGASRARVLRSMRRFLFFFLFVCHAVSYSPSNLLECPVFQPNIVTSLIHVAGKSVISQKPSNFPGLENFLHLYFEVRKAVACTFLGE